MATNTKILATRDNARRLAETIGTLDKPKSTKDAAQALGITVDYLNRLARSGQLRFAPTTRRGLTLWMPAAMHEVNNLLIENERETRQNAAGR